VAETPQGHESLEYIDIPDVQNAWTTGKMSPNVFYWGNTYVDASLLPKPVSDAGGPFLAISGGDAVSKIGDVHTSLYRLIPVPPDKKTVSVSIDWSLDVNTWVVTKDKLSSFIGVAFTDGSRGSARTDLVRVGGLRGQKTWVTAKRVLPVPPGAKNLLFSACVYRGDTLNIRNLNVSFQ